MCNEFDKISLHKNFKSSPAECSSCVRSSLHNAKDGEQAIEAVSEAISSAIFNNKPTSLNCLGKAQT